MVPDLPLGGIRVPTHELFTVAGFAVAGLVLAVLARREGRWGGDLGWIVAGGLVCAAVFAKAGASWRYVAQADDPTLWGILLYGGKTVLGGLVGAYVGVEVTKRLIGYRRSTGDLFAPAVALGLAVGRVGCLLTEQVGTPTSLPWGITVPADVGARIPNCPQCLEGVPLHPSFAYEILFLAAMSVVMLWFRRRVRVEGDSFRFFLIAYGVFRFVVEFVRGNQDLLWSLSGSQVFLILTSPLAVWFVVRRVRARWFPVPAVAEAGEPGMAR